MKLRSSVIAMLLIGIVFIGAYYPSDNAKQKENLILNTVLSILEQAHFQPVEMDDQFSREAFDYYLSFIDNGKRFLTRKDIHELEKYYTEIDDLAKARSLEFFDLSIDLLDKGIAKAHNFYNDLIDDPINLDNEGYVELDNEKKPFPVDDAALKENWRKNLTYEIITKVDRSIKSKEESEESFEMDGLVEKAREDVKELYDDWFNRIEKLRRGDRFEAYLNTFTHLYDPHSDYLTPKGKQDFDIGMGGKLEGIGARLTADGDYTKIASIVPGGPAWKGKELEVDDLILAVTQEGEESLDIFGMRVDDVVQKIRGKKGTVVILSVKKKDGTEQDIRIERDVVIIDESFARSVILDIPGVIDNVGYIKLPKFYSSFEGKDGNSSSTDVAKEISKLKDQNINGIILDLRFNGGGSLPEVVEMSGLFIEDGPIVQVKPRDRRAFVYEDEDPKVHWDGPLIVMVNSYSASASEILAAALQDYKRAVIIGSNSTYGKGTVQRIYDLDRAVRGARSLKPLGQMLLTMQKYYRISGGSVQLKGVQSDIVLPDIYSHLDIGEKEYDHAMAWSEIEGVDYEQNVMVLNNIDLLRTKSNLRVQEKEDFDLVEENAQRLKRNRNMTKYPINLAKYQEIVKQRELENKKFENLLSSEIEDLKVRNLEVDIASINLDESTKARNEDWISRIKKDIYIEESLHVVKDIISNM